MKINLLLLLILFLMACQGKVDVSPNNNQKKFIASMTEKAYGTLDGQRINEYTFQNAKGMSISIINYGGIITKIEVPDKDGVIKDVALGFDNFTGYTGAHPYFGALVGRYGNRIAAGQFNIDDEKYQLDINNKPNSLHGGLTGFDKRIWDVKTTRIDQTNGITLSGRSKDGDQGFPGNLDVTVSYLLNDDNELIINYHAVTDKPTIINLTNHSYFNLKGNGEGDVLGHEVQLMADRFTPVDETLIPLGEYRSVAGTPFDFNKSTSIGSRINEENQQINFGGGYDHNWILNDQRGDLSLAATVYEPVSGRFMEVLTTEPGIQFYTGNFLDGTSGKSGKPYHPRYGFCLETQHYPDSPNQEDFPSTILRPGETYESQTVYRFSVK